jgi:hypothetical protein
MDETPSSGHKVRKGWVLPPNGARRGLGGRRRGIPVPLAGAGPGKNPGTDRSILLTFGGDRPPYIIEDPMGEASMSPSLRLPAAAVLCVAPFLLPTEISAQEPPTPEEVQAAEAAPLFQTHVPLEMTLTANFHALREDDRSDEDSEERPARMEWVDADGTTSSQDIQIQTRGNFRLSTRNCDFPPLRLNVKKGAVEGTLFEGQDKIKLVSPCKLGQDYWQQYVLAEYLVYRMFNVLTPLGFRARMARITYVDDSGEDDAFTRYAFLLEDDSDMAKRNGGVKQDWQGGQLNPVLLEKNQAILVEFFQYMIGNTDWSGAEMHNMELVRLADGRPATVPFDFDFSGIVDARYAAPDHSLSIRSVRQRLFRGFCPDQMNRRPEDYQAVIDLLQEKKEEIYDLWRNQEGLDPDRLKDTLEYLDDFYETLDRPDRVQRNLLDQCVRIGT